MSLKDRPIDPELGKLLQSGRIIRPVPDIVRARVRARAISAAARAEAGWAPPPQPGRVRFAWAGALALTLAAGASAALLHRPHGVSEAAAPACPPPPTPVARALAGAPQDAPPVAAPDPIPSSRRRAVAPSPRPLSREESYAAEVQLLQRASGAHAARNFAAALALVAEHARRFPNGRLAEEREALQVQALAASGRTLDARRVAARFARRFPRSVLLPRLQETAQNAE